MVRIPEDIGILVIISEVRRTIIIGAFKLTDALSLLLKVGGDIVNVTRHFTCSHCVTDLMLIYALILPHLFLLCCHEIPILSVRIVGLGGISTGIDVRMGYDAAPLVNSALSTSITTLASTMCSPTFNTSTTTTTGVNARYLEIITAVMSLAYNKVVGNMASITRKIIMQYHRLDFGNEMVDVLCLDTPKEEYYLLLDSPVIILMVSQCGLEVVLIHM